MGDMKLDFGVRAHIQAFENEVKNRIGPTSSIRFCPCVRSTMVYFDPRTRHLNNILSLLVDAFSSTPDAADITFPGRRITLPIVLDDSWNKEALEKYMRTIRDRAVYLPSNIEYLAKNNGLGEAAEALESLSKSDWVS